MPSHGTAEPIEAGADRSTSESGSKSQDKADQESQPTATAAEAATSAQAFAKTKLRSQMALNYRWTGVSFAAIALFDWLYDRAGNVTFRDGRAYLVTAPFHGVSLKAFAEYSGKSIYSAKRAAAELQAIGMLESRQKVEGWYWRLSIDLKAIQPDEERRLKRKAERIAATVAKAEKVLKDEAPKRPRRRKASAEPVAATSAEPRSHSFQEAEPAPAIPRGRTAYATASEVPPALPSSGRSSQVRTDLEDHHHQTSSTSQDAARSPEGGGGGLVLVGVSDETGQAVGDLIDRLERIGADERQGLAEIRQALVTEIATFGQAVGDLPEAGRQRLVEAVNRIYRQAGQRKGSTVGAVGETLVSRAGFEPVRTSEEPTETEATAQEALQALLKADVLRPVAEGLVAKVAPEAIVANVEAVRSDGQVRNPAAVIVARLKAWQAGDPLPAKARSPLPIGCYYDETGAARTASGARLDR